MLNSAEQMRMNQRSIDWTVLDLTSLGNVGHYRFKTALTSASFIDTKLVCRTIATEEIHTLIGTG